MQDHGFLVGDCDADTPFETMDYTTGLAGVMPSAAMIYTGIERRSVTVTAETRSAGPALETPEQWATLAQWDDVAEISLYARRTATCASTIYSTHLPSRAPSCRCSVQPVPATTAYASMPAAGTNTTTSSSAPQTRSTTSSVGRTQRPRL